MGHLRGVVLEFVFYVFNRCLRREFLLSSMIALYLYWSSIIRSSQTGFIEDCVS